MSVTTLAPKTRSAADPRAAASRTDAADGVRLCQDQYDDARVTGGVLGTTSSSGAVRKGIDVEGVLGIDHGALRIRPLVKPGWGRSGIAYGPFARQNGLALCVSLTNGHNTSQAEPPIEGLRSRFRRWLLGTETERPLKRLVRWTTSLQRRYFWRTLRQWLRTGSRFIQPELLDENLALGWFPVETPTDPCQTGNGMIMHALGAECGELWTRVGEGCQKVVRGVQNVPMTYCIVLREHGAAYYGCSIPGVPGVGTHPTMRLLAIDWRASDPEVYAGIHQSVLGQIGFRVDTRVHGTQAAVLPEWDRWFGTAHGADSLSGTGALHLSPAEAGGVWLVTEGSFERTECGIVGTDAVNTASLALDQPAGFVHVLATAPVSPSSGGIRWRVVDEENYWALDFGTDGCRVSVIEAGDVSIVLTRSDLTLTPDAVHSVQIADDGSTLQFYLNATPVFEAPILDSRHANGCGVGLQARGHGGLTFRALEVHPRDISLPALLRQELPTVPCGSRTVVDDQFARPPGELAGQTVNGGQVWERTVGRGSFHVTSDGAVKVDASVKRPNPGRTAYTIHWPHPGFADLEVNITPPGTRKGQDERGRGGIIFWQDADNYITVSLWMNDTYGFSISSFFRLGGYEELYDAVWTNIGSRVSFGVPFDLRVAFDGNKYLARVNGEPVLYRALTDVYPEQPRLQIRRVGIVANWEWGNDTGSLFRSFAARI